MKEPIYNRFWKTLKKWTDKVFKRDNDEDDYLDHPFAIF